MLLRKTETCRSGFDCRGVSRRSETSLGNACCQHRRAEPLSPSPFQSVPVEKRKSSLEVFLKFTAKVNYVLFTGRYQNSFNQNILLDLWLFWFWACFLHIDLEPFFLPLLSSTKFWDFCSWCSKQVFFWPGHCEIRSSLSSRVCFLFKLSGKIDRDCFLVATYDESRWLKKQTENLSGQVWRNVTHKGRVREGNVVADLVRGNGHFP